jgi:hypothetical protein
MSETPSYIALITALGFSLSPHSAQAQGGKTEVGRLEFSAAVNLVEKNVKVDGSIVLPRKDLKVRAVIVAINWGLGPEIYEDPQWLGLSDKLESGLLLARITNIGRPDSAISQEVVRDAAVGGADGLIMLLQRLAVESRHQELERAPILLWGHSAAGSFAASFAILQPQRTIGFVRYHSHRRGLPLDMKVLRGVPALILAGGKDDIAGVEDSEDLWKQGRSLGAPWTFAVEPDAPHGSEQSLKKANDLVIPWITAVFGQRLSPSGAVLRRVDDSSGWMGDNRTGDAAPNATFPSSKLEASWLPDEPSSRGWRTVLRATR